MFSFSDIVETQRESEFVTEKNVSDGKEMSKNINDRSQTEFASVQDPLNMQRTTLNKTTLVSEIPNIINEKCFYCTRAKKNSRVQFKVMNFVKSKHFHIYFLRVHLVIMLLEIARSCSVF